MKCGMRNDQARGRYYRGRSKEVIGLPLATEGTQEGGWRNVHSRGRYFRGRSKEEGGRRNDQARGRYRGMWKVECGMRNVYSRGKFKRKVY